MRILNPQQDPFLDFAETERCRGRRQFAPWTTSDTMLLALAQRYFPQIPLVAADKLEKPSLNPVEILPLQPALHDVKQKSSFIAVGGPPAAAVALERSFQGESVLYASDLESEHLGKQTRPIWAGAGNHGEPDGLTEGPAYIAGHQPLAFIWRAALAACRRPAYDDQVLDPDFSWLSLNVREWLRNPGQWPGALRVLWGNHRLAQRYLKEQRLGKRPEILELMQNRTQRSGEYLESLNERLNDLLREPRGSLLIAASPAQVEAYQRDAVSLQAEGRSLRPLTPEEVQKKYGLVPRQALALLEKTHDFIFEPDFLNKMTQALEHSGGEVKKNWRLVRVYVDTDKKEGGVLEFQENGQSHYRRFSQAHLSLGATPFHPRVYDLISVTGVSMNALIFDANLGGGPLVCGGSNHLVPLLPPKQIELADPKTGQKRLVWTTFARLSAGACVSPLDRGDAWYHYDGRQAVHLLHRIRETLPPEMEIKLLSVIGCNRVIGKDGRQVELHPTITVNGKHILCEQVTIQVGAGGGGLTQMGALPWAIRADSALRSR